MIVPQLDSETGGGARWGAYLARAGGGRGAGLANRAKLIILAFAARRFDERLRGISTLCAFEFSDDGERTCLRIDDGALSIVAHEGRRESHVDCVVSCAVDAFMDVFHGRQKLFTAIMQGHITLRGNLSVALALQRIMMPMPH